MTAEKRLPAWLGDALGERHDAATTIGIVIDALALAFVAAWIGGDVLPRTPLFVGVLVAAGVFLYGAETRRAVFVSTLYGLAALFALAPLGYQLPYVLGTNEPFAHVLSTTDVIVTLGWWVLAAIPAVAGYRLETGPLLPRLADRVRERDT
jgi:hypothetical protein